MKFIKEFSSETLMNQEKDKIKHGDSAFLFCVKNKQGKIDTLSMYDQRHPGPCCPEVYKAYPVNMSPVKLDPSSSKRKPEVGDILYSTNDEKLTLDAQTNNIKNTAIAICVIPEVTENFKLGDKSGKTTKTARFVSINYMNYTTPTTGSKNVQNITFGNTYSHAGNVKGGHGKTDYVGGKWNTDKCLHACTKENKDLTNGVTDDWDNGYCAPVCCCVAYSTPGTKSGDWYLPSVGELYKLSTNKTVINEKRNDLVGCAYRITSYWSSRTYDNYDNEYYVDIYDGTIDYESTDNGCEYTLAFLAVEV